MSISKNIKKLLVAGAALIMAASAGANLNNVNAKRRYHYNTHRTYRHQANHRHKRTHHSYRNRSKYIYHHKHIRRHINHKTKGNSLTSYVYIADPDEMKSMLQDYSNFSKSKFLKKYSYDGKHVRAYNIGGTFYPEKDCINMAKGYGQSLITYIKKNATKHSPLHTYYDDGNKIYLTSGQIHQLAKGNGMSVKTYIYDYLTHNKEYTHKLNIRQARRDFNQFVYAYRNRGRKVSKYWYKNNYPTSLLLKTTNQDALKDLNRDRIRNGIGTLAPNSYLQKIADNYNYYQYYLDGVNPKQLTRHQRRLYYYLKNKYSQNYGGSAFAMISGVYMPGYKPWSIANQENRSMQKYNDLRLSPNYSQIGISILPVSGDFVEEYGTDEYANMNARDLRKNSSNQNGSELVNTTTIKQQTIKDLSQDRASVNESPLSEDSDLDSEAQRRSQELVSNFSHQNANGQYASDEDSNVSAENIAYVSGSGDKAAANTMNNSMFYDEEANGGIHYQNIVNNTNVGVGVTIKNGNVYLAEDFN